MIWIIGIALVVVVALIPFVIEIFGDALRTSSLDFEQPEELKPARLHNRGPK